MALKEICAEIKDSVCGIAALTDSNEEKKKQRIRCDYTVYTQHTAEYTHNFNVIVLIFESGLLLCCIKCMTYAVCQCCTKQYSVVVSFFFSLIFFFLSFCKYGILLRYFYDCSMTVCVYFYSFRPHFGKTNAKYITNYYRRFCRC